MKKNRIQENKQEPDWSALHTLASVACEVAEKEAFLQRKESKKRAWNDQETIIIPRKKGSSPRKRRRFQSPNEENTTTPELLLAENKDVQSQENKSHNQNDVPVMADPEKERVLVFVRTFTYTDMSKHHGKLALPKSTMLVERFLTYEEEERLSYDKVPAKLIGPRGDVYDIWLRKTLVGKTTHCYTIGKPWNEIVKNNEFGEGDKVGLRAWRKNRNDLWLSLDMIEKSKLL